MIKTRPTKEIVDMYNKIKNDGVVSPSVKETLEWVMNIESDDDYAFLFNLTRQSFTNVEAEK